MITGFNTDIEHRGMVFHVQTEENGPSNPVVVTLVYCGGEVIASLEAAYSARAEISQLSDEQIRDRMSQQHQGLIDAIRRGKYDPAPRPFGEEYVSGGSLDEVVLGYLEQAITPEPILPSARRLAELRDAPDPVKVQKVLDRLERFLGAARRAEVGVAVPQPVVATQSAPRVEPTPIVRREGQTRTPPGVWLLTGLVMLSGVVSLFFFGQREDLPRRTVRQSVISPSPVEPPPPPQQPRPVVELEQPAEPRPSLTPATVSPTGQFEPRPAAATRTAGLTPSRSVAPAPAPTPVATPVAVDESSSPAESQPMEPTVSTVEAETEIDLPPPVEAGQLFDLDQVDVRPLARSRDLPRYPRRARRLGKQGRVTMRILIDHRGTVEQVELIEGIPGTDLTDAAIEAARGWRFSPAREAGQPVRVWRDVVLNFSLRDNGTTSVRIE